MKSKQNKLSNILSNINAIEAIPSLRTFGIVFGLFIGLKEP